MHPKRAGISPCGKEQSSGSVAALREASSDMAAGQKNNCDDVIKIGISIIKFFWMGYGEGFFFQKEAFPVIVILFAYFVRRKIRFAVLLWFLYLGFAQTHQRDFIPLESQHAIL